MVKAQLSRLKDLLEYARQTALMRDNPRSRIEEYKIFTAYEHDFQKLPGLRLNSPVDDEEIWLSLERLHESPPPFVEDPMLAVWIDGLNDPNKFPVLKDSVLPTDLQPLGFNQTDFPDPIARVSMDELEIETDVKTAFEDYRKDWKIWSEKEKPRRKSISLYGKLFALNQQLEGGTDNAQLELIWGIGVALWNLNNSEIRFPLISKPVELSINDETMEIEIRPRDIEPKIELEIYSNEDVQEVAKLQKASTEFFRTSEYTVSPFDRGSYEGLLKSAAALLDPRGIYWPDENPDLDNRGLPSIDKNLKITDSWVLFARPRGASIFVQDLERFQRKLQNEAEDIILPNAVRTLVTEPGSEIEEIDLPAFRGLSTVSAGSSSKEPHELFFPMPFNDEQVNIVQHLEVEDGVIVQGPPGTGKTHTIANIICHYLASGKRVLVTSMREPALAVLQDKLPPDIRPFAVSLLVNESKGMKQFQYAIERIASIAQETDKSQTEEQIRRQEAEIEEYHSRIAKIDRQIAKWADLSLHTIILGTEQIEPRTAAEEVIANLDDVAWLSDVISIEPKHNPQFNDFDIQNLRTARSTLAGDLDYLNSRLPVSKDLPKISDIIEMHRSLDHLNQINNRIVSGEIPEPINSSDLVFEQIEIAKRKVEDLANLRTEIRNAGVEWTSTLLHWLRMGRKDEAITIFCKIGTEMEAVVEKQRMFLAKPVTIPPNFELNTELVKAVYNLAQGVRPFGLRGIIGKAQEKNALKSVNIVGSPPVSQDEWEVVQNYLEYRTELNKLAIRWNAISNGLGIPELPSNPSSVQDAVEAFRLYKKLAQSVQYELDIAASLKTIFPPWNMVARLGDTEDTLKEIDRVLDEHLTRNRLSIMWRTKEQFNSVLETCSGRVVDELREFYKLIGGQSLDEEWIQSRWLEITSEIRRIETLHGMLETVESITALIEQSGATEWAHALRTSPAITSIDALLPNNWQKLWRLKRLACYLEESDGRSQVKSLKEQRSETEKQLARTYQETIRNRTHLKLKENTTPSVSSALASFRKAIGKIGKGTGKRAVRYRADARDAAKQANLAVPCWVMPHYRVSESLPPEFGSFDLAIIDEASQSDLTALPAILRAKKILVVGDEKQVSPDGIGMAEEKIRQMSEQYLSAQVPLFKPLMTPERSIYDLLSVVFAKSGIMLKEHFRCVAPIIEYSRRECYDYQLIPLRLPKRSERLDPPLVDILVEDGVRNGKQNKPEAKFIVQEIKRITNDPNLANRTIGVVSLLGFEQAKSIDQMIQNEIGIEKVRQFKISCGDARTFQGNERDIMFLSLVATKGSSPLAEQSYAQRFNVAASRARDRMYLVRSADVNDLSEKDIYRRSLLQHFLSPFKQDEARVKDLRELCESNFEREVYDLLTERGYNVIPQVPVGGFRIDMVVEGDDDSRVAIECDGDRYHGPGEWDSDMRRQRILERAGWFFWRCFASTFTLYREDVVRDLLETLGLRGIFPSESGGVSPSRYVEHRSYNAYDNPEEGNVSERDHDEAFEDRISEDNTSQSTLF